MTKTFCFQLLRREHACYMFIPLIKWHCNSVSRLNDDDNSIRLSTHFLDRLLMRIEIELIEGKENDKGIDK